MITQFVRSLIVCLTLGCYAEKVEKCRDKYQYEVRCLPDGNGYANYDCVQKSGVTGKDSHKGDMVWQMDMKNPGLVWCTKPQSACRCYENFFWNDYEQGCKCYNPTKITKFASYGVIRWNGKVHVKNEEEYEYTKELKGEVHKSSDGNYIKKEWSHDKNLTLFELRVRGNDGKFIKYTGDTSEKICNIEEGVSEGTLMSIWPKYSSDKEVSMVDEDDRKGPKSVQKWTKTEDHGEFEHKRQWLVQYDKTKNHVIPLEYHYKEQVWVVDEFKTEDLFYHFEILGNNVKLFRLEDYCTNIIPQQSNNSKDF